MKIIGGVDVLRYAASLLVVVNHMLHMWGPATPGMPLALLSRAAVPWMSFFFLCSGFVITHVYTSAPPGRFSATGFMVTRLARIYPMHLLALVALAIPTALLGRLRLDVLVSHLTLTQAWFPSLVPRLNAPSWSLSSELFCYVVFAFVLFRYLVTATRRSLFLVAIGAFALLMGVIAAYGIVDPDGAGLEGPQDARGRVAFEMGLYWPPRVFLEFLIGACVCRIRHLTPYDGEKSTSLLLVGSMLCVGLLIYWCPYLPLHSGLAVPPFVALLWACTDDKHPVIAYFSGPRSAALGRASFSIYMMHMPLLYVLNAFPPSVPLCAAALVFLGTVSLLSSPYFEAPIQKWARRKWEPRRAMSPLASPIAQGVAAAGLESEREAS